jgi:hypothetical protein
MKYWEIIACNLKKRGWVGAVSQRLIPTGERSGLQTPLAAMESVSLYERMNFETMDGPEILKSVDRIDKLDKIGRRTFGLDDAQTQVVQTLVNVNIPDA